MPPFLQAMPMHSNLPHRNTRTPQHPHPTTPTPMCGMCGAGDRSHGKPPARRRRSVRLRRERRNGARNKKAWNRRPDLRPQVRPEGRPRGDVKRSETVVSEKNPHTPCVVRVRGTTSNRNPQVGLAGGNLQANNPKSEILAQVRGAISHLHKAATAARAFARPRGDVERSETVVSEKNPHTRCVVPRRGLEPPRPYGH